MIALFLAAQLGAATLPSVLPPEQIAPPRTTVAPRSEIIQGRPVATSCAGSTGRLEASLAEPTALYRKGDRPAKGLKRWADYPEGAMCLIGAGR
jgi:hypothetical protein